MTSALPRANDDWKRIAFIGYAIIFMTFGVVGGWAATAPLDSAAVATGVVAAESNRKTVQHFEGGIVSRILVKEGDRVVAGQTLFQLDATQPRANLDITRNQLIASLAQEARLIAERDSRDDIQFADEILRQETDPLVARSIIDQRRQFQERRASVEGQIGLLRQRIEQLRNEITGLDLERAGKERQVEILNDEIVGLRGLFEKGLTPKTRLLALERERSSLEGQIGRSIADRSKAENGIGEADLQIKQIRQQFYEQVSRDIVETRSKIGDLRERYAVAQDVLRRLDVISPATGSVQSLRIFSAGAVIRSGEALIDVVPEEDDLIVQAQFSPNDADNVRTSMTAEVRFPSFHFKTLPMIPGTVSSMSRDRLIDEATKQPYFLAIVRVNHKDLPEELRGRLKPGLPSEVVVPTGERTVMQYLVEPLTNTLRKTMREQ